MKAKRNTKVENAIRDSINQTISYEDINVPKLCKVPSIEQLLRTQSNIPLTILSAYNRKGKFADKSANTWRLIMTEQDKYHSPFEISVYGAFPFMGDWKILKEWMRIAYDKKAQLEYIGDDIKNGYKYKTINFEEYKKDKVLKRLKGFAQGFQYGFDSFIATHIDTASAISTDRNFKIQRVFDFLSTTSEPTTGFQTIRFNTIEQQEYDGWYDDGVQTGYEYHAWYYILTNHTSFESYFKLKQKKSQISKKRKKKKSTVISTAVKQDNLKETRIIEDNQNENKIDPLTLIAPFFLNLFIEAETKALGDLATFKSKIRCAAFCEMLYERKYITNTKNRPTTLKTFAKNRYNLDIKNALAPSANKKYDRNNHKTKIVSKMLPLRYCFP